MAVKIESPVNRTGEGYEPVDNGKPVAIEEWWENKIKLCEKFHQNEFEKKTERFGKYYQGLFYSGKEDRDRLSVNLVFSNANIFTSSILSQNPEVIVRPRKKEEEQGAKVLTAAFPGVLETNGFEAGVESMLLDSYVFSLGWAKTLWNEALDMPESSRVSPFDVLVPPTAQSLLDMNSVPYLIHRTQLPLKTVKENRNYKNTEKLKGDKKIRFRSELDARNEYGSDVNLITLYECHTMEDRRIFTLAEGKVLRNIDDPDADVLPWDLRFIPLIFFSLGDKIWPIPLVQIYESLQLEKNLIRTQMARHRRRNNPRYVGPRGTMKKTDITKFEQNEDSSYFEFDGNIGPTPLNIANIPMDTYNLEGLIDRDVDKTTGITEGMRGIQSSKEQTATEANIIQGNARLRAGKLQRIFERFVIKLVRGQAKLMSKYWTTEKFTKITGLPGWHSFSGEDIKGDYLFSITSGSMLPQDKQTMRQELLLMADFIAKFKPFVPNANLEPVMRRALELYGMPVEEVFEQKMPVLPPMQPPGLPPEMGLGGAPLGEILGIPPGGGNAEL